MSDLASKELDAHIQTRNNAGVQAQLVELEAQRAIMSTRAVTFAAENAVLRLDVREAEVRADGNAALYKQMREALTALGETHEALKAKYEALLVIASTPPAPDKPTPPR